MTDLTDLTGRTAVVTGGATLIGHGVVRTLRSAGADVVVVDIDDEGANAIVAELGDGVSYRHLDVTNTDELERLVGDLDGLDVLVNLAATYLDEGSETPRDDWLTALNVNFVSAVELARVARPKLAESGHGAIVNFTSISSKVAQTGRWVYPACKAAMVSVTRSMAMDYAGDGIRVNSVSPGWTWSKIMDELSQHNRDKTDAVAAPFHFTGRVGDPDEVGRIVAFLASDAASVVTGADWAADGGYSAMGPEQAIPAIPKLME